MHVPLILSLFGISKVTHWKATCLAHDFPDNFSVGFPFLQTLSLLATEHVVSWPDVWELDDLTVHEAPGEVEDRKWEDFDDIESHGD